jgi:hypothetical protein
MSATKSSHTVFVVLASLFAVGLLATIVLRQQSQQPSQKDTFDNPVGGKELSSRYFTRFYIPVILSILAIAFVIVLLTMSPGLPLNAMVNI